MDAQVAGHENGGQYGHHRLEHVAEDDHQRQGAAEGAIILLTAGQTYDYSSATIDLTRSVTIQAAPGGTKPLLYVKSFILGGTTETASTSWWSAPAGRKSPMRSTIFQMES